MTSSRPKTGRKETINDLREKFEELKILQQEEEDMRSGVIGMRSGMGQSLVKQRSLNFSKSSLVRSNTRSLRLGNIDETYGTDAYYLKLDARNFAEGLETKVRHYVRLYTSFINAGRKFLLAHNRYVSSFNLVKGQWGEHRRYDDGYV